MQTKTYTVYSFDELSKEAQEKALQNWRDDNNYEFLGDHLDGVLSKLLEKNGLTGDAKIYFSLSNSQGDGAMFEGVFCWKKYKDYNFRVKQSGHYYHENSKTIDIDTNFDNGGDITGEQYEKINQEFDALYCDICKQLEKAGYAYIDDENNAEYIAEIFGANDYQFTDDGQID